MFMSVEDDFFFLAGLGQLNEPIEISSGSEIEDNELNINDAMSEYPQVHLEFRIRNPGYT